jgi:dihydrolipoamide dehydrogenase
MNVVQGLLERNPEASVAVVDKDEPGGICLNKACIPSKLLGYPAEMVRQVQEASRHGIQAEIRGIDFRAIMERMRGTVSEESRAIKENLSQSEDLDYYQGVAEFTGPYSMRVNGEEIRGDLILLCPGSRPAIPDIQGLEEAPYLTSDTLLQLEELPESLIIIGGGYVAAEYGHFFSAMGSEVTVLGRNPQFLPGEEPEVGAVALEKMSEYMEILPDHEVVLVRTGEDRSVRVLARHRTTGQEREIEAEQLLVAAGRSSNTDLLRVDRAGLNTDSGGWLQVNGQLETSVKSVYAFGDAIGRHLYKHVANYESRVVYANAVLGYSMSVDYHAVPHAVFAWPEIAAVGLKEREAVDMYGEDGVAIGFHPFEETARGEAMGAENCFIKVVLEESTERLLGAHIIGPQASILIQELITLMYTEDRSTLPVVRGMHIHPSLSEVVEQAFFNIMPQREYQQMVRRMIPEIFE